MEWATLGWHRVGELTGVRSSGVVMLLTCGWVRWGVVWRGGQELGWSRKCRVIWHPRHLPFSLQSPFWLKAQSPRASCNLSSCMNAHIRDD